MLRLVDVDEIKKREKDVVLANGAKHRCFDTTMLYELPTVDAEPVRHGHWTNIKISVTGNSSAECSLCGTVVHDTFADVDRLNYCPHCGAKMDPVEEYAYVDPDIYPCRICEDYDGKGGCMSKGGCGQRGEDE